MRVTGSANPQENGLFYTVGDHLGSASLVVDSAGNKLSEMRYSPWGETRYQGGTPPTDYGYTGQREEAGIGLYYYNARWYDAKLGRFAQADTVIPQHLYPASFDRYSYVLNSPLRFTDPSGNLVETCNDYMGHIVCTYKEVVLIIVCGDNYSAVGSRCVNNKTGEVGFDDVVTEAEEKGITVVVIGNTCTAENPCDRKGQANEVEEAMADHPGADFIFIGHSGGAEVVILAVSNYLAKGGKPSKILGVMLLGENLDDADQEQIDDMENLGIRVDSYISVYDAARDPDWNPGGLGKKVNSPDGSIVIFDSNQLNLYGFFGNNYNIFSYSGAWGWTHTALATNGELHTSWLDNVMGW